MSIQLKIKSKHLGEEARVIRFEERKLLKNLRSNIAYHNTSGANSTYSYYTDKNYSNYLSISSHRKWEVRNENRATFLARAYLAGKSYSSVEQSCKDVEKLQHYIIPRVVAMVNSYKNRNDPAVDQATISAWTK